MYNQIPGYSAVYGSCGYIPPNQSPMPQPVNNQSITPLTQNTAAAQPAASASETPITDTTQPMPVTTESMQYMNGFLRTQIGRRIRVEFLVGTNTFMDKFGKLIGVGANYILLQEAMSDDLVVCDFFSIKFITIFR